MLNPNSFQTSLKMIVNRNQLPSPRKNIGLMPKTLEMNWLMSPVWASISIRIPERVTQDRKCGR
ncbi:hypothetical protein D3C71_2171220 [compost metagenome]